MQTVDVGEMFAALWPRTNVLSVLKKLYKFTLKGKRSNTSEKNDRRQAFHARGNLNDQWI